MMMTDRKASGLLRLGVSVSRFSKKRRIFAELGSGVLTLSESAGRQRPSMLCDKKDRGKWHANGVFCEGFLAAVD
jgi:hypothetical protein